MRLFNYKSDKTSTIRESQKRFENTSVKINLETIYSNYKYLLYSLRNLQNYKLFLC